MPTPKPNRWHPCLLPDNYIRKMKQDLADMEEMIESKTKLERVFDDRPAFDFDQSPEGERLTSDD